MHRETSIIYSEFLIGGNFAAKSWVISFFNFIRISTVEHGYLENKLKQCGLMTSTKYIPLINNHVAHNRCVFKAL